MPNMIRCYPLDRHGGMAVVSVDDPRGISYVRLDAMEQAVRQSCWMMWHMSGDDYNAEHGATEEEITDAAAVAFADAYNARIATIDADYADAYVYAYAYADALADAADAANRQWREAKAALEAAEKEMTNE